MRGAENTWLQSATGEEKLSESTPWAAWSAGSSGRVWPSGIWGKDVHPQHSPGWPGEQGCRMWAQP